MHYRTVSTTAILCTIIIIAGCGASSIGGGSNPDGSLSTGGDGGADARVNCIRATECSGTQVCNPSTQMCVATFSCSTHANCGHEAVCQGTMCVRNTLHGECENNDNCLGQESCVAGRCGCGGELLEAAVVAPNMLIALDRSDSMNQGGPPSKWTIAKRAIDALTAANEGTVRFGLTLWPGTNQTCQGGQQDCQGVNHAVSIDFDRSAEITGYLADTNTHTCTLFTPIGGTLNSLISLPSLDDTTRDNYVMLITDGSENCGGDGPAAAKALFDGTPRVRTFVVGFGSGVNRNNLNDLAVAGGTDRPGATKFFQANDETELQAAFDEIAGSVASCTYTLSGNPDDANRVYVFLGQTMVARDPTHQTGWDFEVATKRLTFYGATCSQVRGGTAPVVSFGCPILP